MLPAGLRLELENQKNSNALPNSKKKNF